MRFIWDMLRWYPFYHLLCTLIYSAKILVILKHAWNSMGKFQKYFSTLGSHNSETPWPNVPIERPLELYSLLFMHCKNQLDRLISSTSYVMDNAHLCLGRRKTKWKTRLNFASKTGHLDWYSNDLDLYEISKIKIHNFFLLATYAIWSATFQFLSVINSYYIWCYLAQIPWF